nr:RteC domain-containing protein [uncultured Bacteroides sp.]
MRTIAEEILSRINAEIELLNYDNDITVDDALHMVKFITPLYSQLRKLVSDYVFPTNEEEIRFFKEIKPNILDKYLYFRKVYNIEMKCPIGNNEIIKEYLNQELEELTRFFVTIWIFINITGQNPLIWIACILSVRKRM